MMLTSRMILVLLIILLGAVPGRAATRGRVSRGNRLFEQGDYAGALENYKEALQKNPESDIINFNAGTTLYKTGEYDESINHLQRSLLTDEDELKAKAHYNLGNSFYRAGMTRADESPDLAVQALEQSLEHYERALSIEKEDEDARFNYDLVKKRLEELKQKQQQQQQKQKSEEDQSQQKDSSQSKGQEGQEQDSSQQKKERESQSEEEKEQEKGQEEQPQAEQHPDESSEEQESQQRFQQQNGERQDEMSQKEAEMLLNDYQQNEEPKGLLNFMKRKTDVAPVKRNW